MRRVDLQIKDIPAHAVKALERILPLEARNKNASPQISLPHGEDEVKDLSDCVVLLAVETQESMAMASPAVSAERAEVAESGRWPSGAAS